MKVELHKCFFHLEQPLVSYPLELAAVSVEYQGLYEESLKNPEDFWKDIAQRKLKWFKMFGKVMECDMESGKFKWFIGGELNVSGKLATKA